MHAPALYTKREPYLQLEIRRKLRIYENLNLFSTGIIRSEKGFFSHFRTSIKMAISSTKICFEGQEKTNFIMRI